MRFNHLDLNLLVALDVLLDEQSITRAAARLHMTQSATSGVLGRLRSYFEDELLVQVGRKMQPTPYAQELAGHVRQVLVMIQSSIIAKPVFDPANSRRHFRIITSDYLIGVFLSEVIREIALLAPFITFEMLSPSDSSEELLTRGEVDLLIMPERFVLDGYPAQLLFEETHSCLVWEGNQRVGDSLTLEQYLEMGHISVGFGRNRTLSIEDWFMKQYGVNRRIEVVTNDFNTVPQLVVGTERIATTHHRLAEFYAGHLPLRLLAPPVKLPTTREFMLWHQCMDGDVMHRWLRERIHELATRMFGPTPEPESAAADPILRRVGI